MFLNKKAGQKPDHFLPLSVPRPGEKRKFLADRAYYDVIRARQLEADLPDEGPSRNQFLAGPLVEADFPAWFAAARHLLIAVEAKQDVLIFGDYDCDGICSTVLMADFLESAGLSAKENIHLFIPDRKQDRYGLQLRSTAKALAACPRKPGLFIAVDCGSPHQESLEKLKAWDIPTLVLDHHQTEAAGAAHPATFHLNPKGWPQMTQRRDDFCELCAAGLVFLFCKFTAELAKNRDWNLDRAFILAGLATTADQVPMRQINRRLVKAAMARCFYSDLDVQGTTPEKSGLELIPGLLALDQIINASALKNGRPLAPVSEATFGFEWGPCLNASGRLDTALLAVKLLREKNPVAAEELARECVRLNRARKYKQDKIMEEARRQAAAQFYNDPPSKVLVVAGSNWHTGVVGIVASRLKEEFWRPVIVCGLATAGLDEAESQDKIPAIPWATERAPFYVPDPSEDKKPGPQETLWCGSGRSIPSYDLGHFIHKAVAMGYLETGGGHHQAGGLTLTENQRPAFHQWINEVCPLKEKDFERVAEVLVDLATTKLDCKELWVCNKKLAPFGQQHPALPFFLENMYLERMSFFKIIPGKSTPEPMLTAQPKFEKHKKDKKRWVAVGHFQKAGQPAVGFCIYWKNIERVRREWRPRKVYTLEVEVRCTRENTQAAADFYLVATDCWLEPATASATGPSQPEFKKYKPGLAAAMARHLNMLPERNPFDCFATSAAKKNVVEQDLNEKLAKLMAQPRTGGK